MADKLKTHEFHQPEPDYLTMNKDELSQALHKLSLSESYMIDRITRSMASCYMIIPPTWIKYSTTCDGCGGECDMFYKTYDNDPPQIIPKYKALAKKFQDLGYQADVRCYCEKCVAKSSDTLAPIVFSFRAEGMREPVLSYPEHSEYEDKNYKQALYFLEGLDSAQTFDAITPHYSRFFDDEDDKPSIRNYSKNIKSIIGPEPQHNKPEPDDRDRLRSWAKEEFEEFEETEEDLPF